MRRSVQPWPNTLSCVTPLCPNAHLPRFFQALAGDACRHPPSGTAFVKPVQPPGSTPRQAGRCGHTIYATGSRLRGSSRGIARGSMFRSAYRFWLHTPVMFTTPTPPTILKDSWPEVIADTRTIHAWYPNGSALHAVGPDPDNIGLVLFVGGIGDKDRKVDGTF
jgi:hypothetical protein